MMTPDNLRLLAAADPWGLETGGLGDCHSGWEETERWTMSLGQVDDTITSGKGVVAAGQKLASAKDFNGVAEGAQEGLKAAGGVVTGLKGAWGGAAKFMISVGGTVDTPALGVKGPGLPMWANAVPTNIDWSGISTTRIWNAKSFLNAVADYWLFYTPSWLKFGFKPPQPGGVTGQVWNPFKGAWQGGGIPIIDPSAEKTMKTLPSYKTAEGEARIKLVQSSVNTLAGANPAYGFDVAFVQQKAAVASGNYLLANQGYLFSGTPRGAFPGLVATIRILTDAQYVKTALALNMTVTQGPNTGELLEHLRVGWIKQLTALVKTMPAASRPSNAGALGVATADGTGTGPPITPKTTNGGAKALGVLFFIGLLLRFLG